MSVDRGCAVCGAAIIRRQGMDLRPRDSILFGLVADATSRPKIRRRDRRTAATIQIAVPTELSPCQRQLIEELAQVNGELSGGEALRKRLLDCVLSLLEDWRSARRAIRSPSTRR